MRPDRSLAAVSAPRRADRNTGLVELFAIIAMRIGLAPAAVPPPPALSTVPVDDVLFGQPPAATAASKTASEARRRSRPRVTRPPLAPDGAPQTARLPARAPPRSRWHSR